MIRKSAFCAITLALAACSSGTPPVALPVPPPGTQPCVTAEARIAFDFETAPAARCVIEGPRAFTVLIGPEHAPPINPSPWYAFRYSASGSGELTVRLRYLGAEHRYAPVWTDGATSRAIAAEVSEDGGEAIMHLPAGDGTVSAQEILDGAHYDALLTRLARGRQAERFTIGRSHDGRPIEAVRMGRPDAPRLVLLLGRQHPPEVTGAIVMESFVERIAALVEADPALGNRYQFVAIPLLNPDGVARGHWRANLGGRDLNRDWGEFTQPETRAVGAWLEALPQSVRPVLMLDFHSTQRSLFYVQGDEASAAGERFLQVWLGGRERAFAGYPFTIERRNANPGSGTSKNWFNATYAIPAYTYEAADDMDRDGGREAAAALAAALPSALTTLEQ